MHSISWEQFEIAAGMLAKAALQIGTWVAAIIVDLLLLSGYYDIGLRARNGCR
ncbi:hypothetical protein [Mycobacterium lepromatosis]|uniref:hypothetical protein n=1 Tax=Mycobacterium lepromatosis TaxID=480418 RepID=UPI00138DDFBE|nr:hypothetical protein [Mycobacterium lepromatosis]